jgi:hypothetical protein
MALPINGCYSDVDVHPNRVRQHNELVIYRLEHERLRNESEIWRLKFEKSEEVISHLQLQLMQKDQRVHSLERMVLELQKELAVKDAEHLSDAILQSKISHTIQQNKIMKKLEDAQMCKCAGKKNEAASEHVIIKYTSADKSSKLAKVLQSNTSGNRPAETTKSCQGCQEGNNIPSMQLKH